MNFTPNLPILKKNYATINNTLEGRQFYVIATIPLTDDNAEIDESFLFKTKFLLGKTGKGELVKLLSQIDGNQNPFESFDTDDFDKLDSVLQTRHLIVHQDRFTGTETTVSDNVAFLKNLVEY